MLPLLLGPAYGWLCRPALLGLTPFPPVRHHTLPPPAAGTCAPAPTLPPAPHPSPAQVSDFNLSKLMEESTVASGGASTLGAMNPRWLVRGRVAGEAAWAGCRVKP